MSPPNKTNAEILSEIVTELKALTPEEFKQELDKANESEWGQIFKSMADQGLQLAPPLIPREHDEVLAKVMDKIANYTPQELEERLAKVCGTPNHLMLVDVAEFGQYVADNAHTKPGLAAPHGVEYKPVIDSTEENQNGQENPPSSGSPEST